MKYKVIEREIAEVGQLFDVTNGNNFFDHGKDRIELNTDDINKLLNGHILYFTDGEYGHEICVRKSDKFCNMRES